jgi:hypothetical protein
MLRFCIHLYIILNFQFSILNSLSQRTQRLLQVYSTQLHINFSIDAL